MRFFRDRRTLVDEVCDFAAVGYELRDRVILALELENAAAVRHELGRRGLDREGRTIFLEAETLASELLPARGGVCAATFESRIGSLIGEEAARGRVRVYGEIVNVLWRGGRVEGSRELERMWGRLGERVGFTLLCGYRVDLLKESADVWEQVCSHQRVLADPAMDELDSALETAVERVLGPQSSMVRALIASDERLKLLPFGQAALLWLRRHMPLMAHKILSPAAAQP